MYFTGRPFPVVNCSVTNQSWDVVEVSCEEGFNGGLPQWFVAEALELPSLNVRLNISSGQPAFRLTGLEPGHDYQLLLYAVNGKGKSEATVIETVSFKGVAKYTGE